MGVTQDSVQHVLPEMCLEMFDHGNTYMRAIKKQIDTRIKALQAEKSCDPEFQQASLQCFREDITMRELVREALYDTCIM